MHSYELDHINESLPFKKLKVRNQKRVNPSPIHRPSFFRTTKY